MKLNYKDCVKRIISICLIAVMLVSGYYAYSEAMSAKADEIIATGHVNYDVTNLRIRTSPGDGDVITKVNGGFKFDVYSEVNIGAEYSWYDIGFLS